MRTLRHLILPIATVWLLLVPIPAVAGDDFDQQNPTPTPGDDFDQEVPTPTPYVDEWYEDGELREDAPDSLILDECAETEQTRVCYVEERDQFWVRDDHADGFSAVGIWYVDLDQDGFRWDGSNDFDPDDRIGYCRNPHGNDTWAMCSMSFDEGLPLFFVAHAFDLDDSEHGVDPRTSGWHETVT